MLGLVLCGGQSSRMGADKGLLKLEARTWAQTAIDKLEVLSIPVALSVNQRQYPEYAVVFPASRLVPDDDSLLIHGPLAGVLSVHCRYPDEDIFILACDMPLMEPPLLKKLYSNYGENRRNEAYIFTNDGEPEPLCGIYTAGGLAATLNRYHLHQLPRHSMKFMLEHLSVFTLPIEEEQKKYFRNFNAHAELNGL
jgi:molybdopterin-guanine dinucleotide biosynthesis protein A